MDLTSWLEHYGYIVIFLSLLLEMLALPIPGEVMMSYTGLLVFEGKLNGTLSIVIASAGVSAGVTLSYWIGYFVGKTLVTKYGHYIHLGDKQLAKLTTWFEKYGNKLLFVVYFIPGVRHFTGYFCGLTHMPFRKYAMYAYPGAIFWVSVFITLGRVLGPKWELYHDTVNHYLIIFGVASVVLTLLVYVYRNHRKRIAGFIMNLLTKGLDYFNSLGKVRSLVLASFAAFVMFVSLMLGLIQDFFAKEFNLFDEITSYIVHVVFGPEWHDPMNYFSKLGSIYFYGPLIVLTAIWVIKKARDQWLELSFLFWVVIGGELLDDGLRMLFHRPGPVVSGFRFLNTFPSEDTLTAITVWGFSAFLLLRHYSKRRLQIPVILTVILICLLVGISRIYFNVQFPSDVAAGYVFGGVWISLNIILLEVLRVLQRSKEIRT
ncbi:bifunctional DedA family/phosphatase PAP2 family protein [Paenibacillus sp. KQZ6P-2]|uniref:Bifunctional DedA family/phosphatase PAP2 family protein n=1 Tax=Paenibacillus mangrovi TaxID=2931978 RepID=A0A9X2B7G0_9BACL|nr:bifunctional DedA family/phosphatase PAP2 family protein [Paenibacillus mangrovi]MCJ8013623.1 bifunctional DedA family/phosphatase PAP2 family protein [Paenibacillus mangrovi]